MSAEGGFKGLVNEMRAYASVLRAVPKETVIEWANDMEALLNREEAALRGGEAVAFKSVHDLVPPGWVLRTADCSVRPSATLMRDKEGTAAWYALDEPVRETTDLYVFGLGATLEDAVRDAAIKVTPLPAAPASEPVGGESRFPCRFKENTGWCETHAQYANDADHCQGVSTPSVPTAEAGVVMTEPPVDVLKRTIQNIESQEIRRSGLFIVDRVDIAILDEIVAALSTPSPQGAVAWISEVGMARLRRGQSCQAYGRGDVQPGVSPFYPAPSGVSEEMVALIADGAEWRRDDGRTYLAIRVADGADLSCVATRRAALKAALSGEEER